MRLDDFNDMFIDYVCNTKEAEEVLQGKIPEMVESVENEELKELFKEYSENITLNIKNLQTILSQRADDICIKKPDCKGMQGLVRELHEFSSKKIKSSIKDAAVLAAFLRISYYVIASFLSLKSFAKFLEYSAVVDLIDESEKREISLQKKLNTLAEGKFYKRGLNEKAEIESQKNEKK
jgi:ferritin-like metal-binding protein YciE